MNPKDMTRYADVLQGMLDQILTRSATEQGSSLEAACLPDIADRASLETDRAMTLIMRERELVIMKDIREALARMDAGEYGVCEECGEDISPARLRAMPAATLCAHCQAILEQGRPLTPDLDRRFMHFEE